MRDAIDAKHGIPADIDVSIAHALDIVGDAWTMLILRDAGAGISRFDDFRKKLAIAPNILTHRLTALTRAGLLERCKYSERPPRFEYALTAAGADFLPILSAMGRWHTRHAQSIGAAQAEAPASPKAAGQGAATSSA